MDTIDPLRRTLLLLLAVTLLCAFVLILGVTSSSVLGLGPFVPTPTPVARQPPPTPSDVSYITYYSVVEYPLQIPVQGTDTATLTLSSQQNILFVTPTPGTSTLPADVPFSLPTDVRPYRDIGVIAQATPTGDSPVLWQPTTPTELSLLIPASASTPRAYLGTVSFRWRLRALRPGPNLVTLSLLVYYILLDGSVQHGSIQISSVPIPILAVQSTAGNTLLPTLRLPLLGAVSLTGIAGVLRFLWEVMQKVDTVAKTVTDVTQAYKTVSGSEHDVPMSPVPKSSQPTEPTEPPPASASAEGSSIGDTTPRPDPHPDDRTDPAKHDQHDHQDHEES